MALQMARQGNCQGNYLVVPVNYPGLCWLCWGRKVELQVEDRDRDMDTVRENSQVLQEDSQVAPQDTGTAGKDTGGSLREDSLEEDSQKGGNQAVQQGTVEEGLQGRLV